MARDQDYTLPSGPLGTAVELSIDGEVYLLERVAIEQLPEFRARHGLRAVGSIGGADTWPPAIVFRPQEG